LAGHFQLLPQFLKGCPVPALQGHAGYAARQVPWQGQPLASQAPQKQREPTQSAVQLLADALQEVEPPPLTAGLALPPASPPEASLLPLS